MSCFLVSREQICIAFSSHIWQHFKLRVNLHENLTSFSHLLRLRHVLSSSEIRYTAGDVKGDACSMATDRDSLCGELWSSAPGNSLSPKWIFSENIKFWWGKWNSGTQGDEQRKTLLYKHCSVQSFYRELLRTVAYPQLSRAWCTLWSVCFNILFLEWVTSSKKPEV